MPFYVKLNGIAQFLQLQVVFDQRYFVFKFYGNLLGSVQVVAQQLNQQVEVW